jgi:hypothetical protein
MSDFPGIEMRQLSPRSHALQYTTPFIQSECTGGQLCGMDFEQAGCYAAPDYSTCHYDATQGATVCTVCICYGFDSGVNGCNNDYFGSSPTKTGGSQASLYPGSSNKRFVPFKSFVLLSCVSLWFNVIGITVVYGLLWYPFFHVILLIEFRLGSPMRRSTKFSKLFRGIYQT